MLSISKCSTAQHFKYIWKMAIIMERQYLKYVFKIYRHVLYLIQLQHSLSSLMPIFQVDLG